MVIPITNPDIIQLDRYEAIALLGIMARQREIEEQLTKPLKSDADYITDMIAKRTGIDKQKLIDEYDIDAIAQIIKKKQK